jgi:hypothetical protein
MIEISRTGIAVRGPIQTDPQVDLVERVRILAKGRVHE